MFAGHRGTVYCGGVEDLASFQDRWVEECRERPRQGGVAVILAAGNVTGLSVVDAISQILEHGRAALVKLHPLHEPFLPVFRDALGPLVDAGMLALVAGGPELVRGALASPTVGHVHLTGVRAAFDAVVWGPDGPRGGSPRRPPGRPGIRARPPRGRRSRSGPEIERLLSAAADVTIDAAAPASARPRLGAEPPRASARICNRRRLHAGCWRSRLLRPAGVPTRAANHAG